jgi:hypothetical protein
MNKARGPFLRSGLAFVQNLRRGQYELAAETPPPMRLAAAAAELAQAI